MRTKSSPLFDASVALLPMPGPRWTGTSVSRPTFPGDSSNTVYLAAYDHRGGPVVYAFDQVGRPPLAGLVLADPLPNPSLDAPASA